MAFLYGSIRFGRAIGTHRTVVRQSLEAMLPARLLELDAFVDDAIAITPEATVGYLQGLGRWNVEDRLRQLRAPTLVVGGARDTIVEPIMLEETIRLVPRGTLDIWPDAGHAPHLEAPDAFVERLVAFTTAHDARIRFMLWLHRMRVLALAFAKSLRLPVRALPPPRD
jgi:pimeloyl-ACP methyl ester carboxylesterase